MTFIKDKGKIKETFSPETKEYTVNEGRKELIHLKSEKRTLEEKIQTFTNLLAKVNEKLSELQPIVDELVVYDENNIKTLNE